MFRGIAEVSVDAKSRMSIPTRYRDDLASQDGGKLVVTIDTHDPCLLLYPLNQWKIIEEKIGALPSFHAATRRIQRLLIGHAHEVDLDKGGRVLLSDVLKRHADLEPKEKAVLVGQGKKFEIWSKTAWDKHCQAWLEESSEGEGDLPQVLDEISV